MPLTFFSESTPKSQCLKITQNVAFEFWHFLPIFVPLKVTRVVTLFVRKNVHIASEALARYVECDFLGDFQTL